MGIAGLAACIALSSCRDHSLVEVYLASVEIRFSEDPDTGHMRAVAASGSGAAHFPPCKSVAWHEEVIRRDGWLRLTLSAPEDEWPHYSRWLAATSRADSTMSNRHLLATVIAALEAGLGELAPPGFLPSFANFIVRMTPTHCRYFELGKIELNSERLKASVPVAFRSPRTLTVNAIPVVVDHLTLVVAHESIHLLQIHPSNKSAARRLTEAPEVTSNGMHMSLVAEFEARLADYCLKQAILPDGPRRRSFMQQWREEADGRRPSWSARQGDPTALRIHESVFSTLYATLGRDFGATSDAALREVFPLCAMAIDGRIAPGASGLVDRNAIERGQRALNAIRAIVPQPLRFPDTYY